MKSYIFLVDDGFTYDKTNKQIENLQVLGVSDGEDILIAFKNFKQSHIYLKDYSFKDVIALEYIGDFIRGLEL